MRCGAPRFEGVEFQGCEYFSHSNPKNQLHPDTTLPRKWSQRQRPRRESPYGRTASHAPVAVPANAAKSRSVERFFSDLLVLIDASATRRNRAATASASACPAISSWVATICNMLDCQSLDVVEGGLGTPGQASVLSLDFTCAIADRASCSGLPEHPNHRCRARTDKHRPR